MGLPVPERTVCGYTKKVSPSHHLFHLLFFEGHAGRSNLVSLFLSPLAAVPREPCKDYARFGNCRYGNMCWYSHAAVSQEPPPYSFKDEPNNKSKPEEEVKNAESEPKQCVLSPA